MKNILFDLDGTLTDPSEGILNCIEYALDKFSAEKPPRESMKKYIGPSLWDSFKELLNTDDHELATKAVLTYRERFSTVGKLENKPYEGIYETLESLKSKNYDLYICTSKPGVFARQIAEHFEFSKYFNNIYGSNLDGTLIDKTELINHILTSEQISPKSASMIGDRKYDITGAKNNSVTPFAVSYGFGTPDEHTDAKHIFSSITEISSYFL